MAADSSQNCSPLTRALDQEIEIQSKDTPTKNVLGNMVYNKDLDCLKGFGETEGLLSFLRIDKSQGLLTGKEEHIPPGTWTQDDSPTKKSSRAFEKTAKMDVAHDLSWIEQLKSLHSIFPTRIKTFGENILPPRKQKSFFKLMLAVLNDKMLLLLVFAAIVSTSIGIYEDVRVTGNSAEDNNDTHWIEGFSIIIAIAIVVLVSASNDYFKDKRFIKLNYKRNDRLVYVTRDGVKQHVSVNCILVGDILHVESGEILCADAVVISSADLKADESSITGESRPQLKLSVEDHIRLNKAAADDLKKYYSEQQNTLSGTKINDKSDSNLLTSNQVDVFKPGQADFSIASSKSIIKSDPFLISGSLIVEGVGECVVVAVGENSFNGQTLLSLTEETEATPLQLKLNDLAELIAKLGGIIAVVMLIALAIRYTVLVTTNQVPRTSTLVVNNVINIITSVLTIIVVAIPEGLPLAITLSLAIATIRMLDDHCMVRVLASCETMGNATTICSDKTGTLTQNKFTVVAGTIGTNSRFRLYPMGEAREMRRRATTTPNDDYFTDANGKPVLKNKIDMYSVEKHTDLPEISIYDPHHLGGSDNSAVTDKVEVDIGCFKDSVSESALNLVLDSISINTSKDSEKYLDSSVTGSKTNVSSSLSTIPDFSGSGTEVALLQWAQKLGEPKILKRRADSVEKLLRLYPFSSAKKSMGVAIENGVDQNGNKMYRLYVKGAPEMLLNESTHVLDTSRSSDDNQLQSTEPDSRISGNVLPLDDERKLVISQTIFDYSSRSLRTIGIMYCDISEHKLKQIDSENCENVWRAAGGLVWVGVFGIEDPLRENVSTSVRQCQKAGVTVRMVTGDSLITARAIATQCGIYTPGMGGVILEGKHFRNLTPAEMDVIVPRLQVLARSTPKDKQLLVDWLKENDEVVAVTGDGTNDAPALRAANVGFSMGISGTEIAKEASDIILMDDNFNSIVKALMWGRCINDSIKKFLQFQLTVNVTAVAISFITSLIGKSSEPVFSPTQLLWLNLIMDTFAALALASDPPSTALLDRYPERKNSPIINITMWKKIVGMSIYQILIIFLTLFAFKEFVDLDYYNPVDYPILRSLVFNSFVWMQLFNEINSRVLGSELNCFKGITKNRLFMGVIFGSAVVQFIIIQFGAQVFQTKRLTPLQWMYSIVAGALVLPMGLLLRVLPDKWFSIVFPFGKDVDVKKPTSLEWQAPAQTVQRQLALLSLIRGGRLKSHNLVEPKFSQKYMFWKPSKTNRSEELSENEIRNKQKKAISRVVKEAMKESNDTSGIQNLNSYAILSEYGPSDELKFLGVKSSKSRSLQDQESPELKPKSGILSKFTKKKDNQPKSKATGFSFAAAMVPTMIGASIGAGMSASSRPKQEDLSDMLTKILEEKETKKSEPDSNS
ncbi:hypothetical protein BB560_003554 [Smittium megazygosporum]|uniref:Calcium-transporting ATPase n=1 Tax=Smittium megazygosporum TaxID=133381 RepID=A0A2T9ZBN4_9FUNG|nr:hypothetical protein BB560_003554 [Smittium megazygosporum]